MSDDWEDDAASHVPVDVTNPKGVTFPAVLTAGFSKAGVVSFYVLDEDAPPGEEAGPRCEKYRQIVGHGPLADQRIYRVVRRSPVASAGSGNPE